MAAIRNFMKWCWLISLLVQSEESLRQAASYLDAFDKQKDVFAKIGCSVNLPKIHSLNHYHQQVRTYGTPDNFDTEYTEHQHIADAKMVYKRTNKINHLEQMVKHVQHRTALEMKLQYLDTLSMMRMQKITTIPHRLVVGSRIPESPMHINVIENKYSFKTLGYCICTYLHDCTFCNGDGI